MLRAVTAAQRTVTLNESVRHRVEAQRYLRELVLPLPALKAVLREYLLAIDQSIQRVSRLEELIATHVPTWSRYPIVQALMCLRGFQLTAAAVLVAELGDVQRFQHPRHLMAFFGLIPREHTTGLVEALSYSAFPPATMKSPTKTKTIAITIALPIRDYETYLAAAKFLAPTLKRKAPDPRSLCLFLLTNREARGLAEDFLELLGMPVTCPKTSVAIVNGLPSRLPRGLASMRARRPKASKM